MIISRYLIREVFSVMLVVLGVILLIFLSNEFVRFISSAASGKISIFTVIKIMSLQVPYLSGLLLPATLYMAFLLVYSRMYADNEMVVFTACGMSSLRLIAISSTLLVFVMSIDIFLNFYVAPKLLNYQNKLLAQAGPANLVNTLQPGRFLATNRGNIVYYVGDVSRDHKQMTTLFIAQHEAPKQGPDKWNILIAKEGSVDVDNQNGSQWLNAQEGYRYSGIPGQGQYQIIHFGNYKTHLGVVENKPRHIYKNMSTTQLWHVRKKDTKAQAEWQWRISVPLMTPILMLIALPLSRLRPRQGRYAKLLPAILLYALYANTMFVARNWVEEGRVPFWIGLWWLHLSFLLLAAGLWFNFSTIRSYFKQKLFS